MNLKCIAIDDEPLALKQIQGYIEKTPFLTLDSAFSNSAVAFEEVEKNSPDLLFIDINMPDLNGIDFIKSLSKPCLVIFTTAYSEFAIDGFKLDAIDYLLKPISYPDFLKAATKAKELYDLRNSNEEKLSGNDDCLFVKSEYRLVRIKYSDIKYIEGMREYVGIHLTDGSRIMTLVNMKSIEERLPKEHFMRVHRSYIVNLDKITVVERQRIVFDKKTYIPISDQYKDIFDDFIRKHFI